MLFYVKDKFTKDFSTLTKFSYVSEKWLLQGDYKRSTLKNLTNKKVPFIYPLFIGSNRIFLDRIPTPPKSTIEIIKSQKAKIVFLYLGEGNVHTSKQIRLLEDFSIECGLTKNEVTFVHGNMLLEHIESPFIKFKYFNLFEASLWQFANVDRNTPESVENYIKLFNAQKFTEKNYHFNCFNRVPRDPRVFLVSLLKSNALVNSKSLVSIGNEKFKQHTYNKESLPFNNTVINQQDDFNNINQYLETEFDTLKLKGLTVDYKDLGNINTHEVNYNIYKDCFIDIISETVYKPKCMFFTEKTFRSISIKQPFFLLGGKDSLKHLKSLGYKTFDKWWDESYDNFDDIYDRTYQAFLIIKKISKLDKKLLSLMISEMQEVLEHNFNHYFYNNRHKTLLW